MSGDISLSQSLGGLRIANPDNDDSPSPPPAPAQQTPPATAQEPPSSSHSSTSTVTTEHQPHSHSLHPVPTDSSSASLDFNPNAFSTSSAPVSDDPSPPPPGADQGPYTSRLNHRQSMPIAQQAQLQAHYSSQPQPPANLGPPRNYPPSVTSIRPQSSFYSHPNLSSSSGVSAGGSYRYNDGAGSQPSAVGLSRSSSRAAAAAMHAAGLPTRETSRSYRQPGPPLGSNGPLPPRRSSRRTPMGPGPPGMGGPYGDGTVPASSEEWQERGAAVGVRQDVDPNGRAVSRVVKKGVKDFNFGRTLGEGSYSTVLAATDRVTLREYAIKVLDKRHIIKEKKVKYVNIEKDTLNRLTEHPGIVRLYYTFQDERSLYFVLDLASGGELLGFLKKMGTFDEECTRFYGAQILDAIDYMHSRGIIHRDLKPENVLLDDQMHVKITDFGTAKILNINKQGSANGSGSVTGDPLDGAETDRAVSFVGTAEYVSPELLTDKNACKASDLWAFGCIIYQLLAGRPPFKAGNEYQTFQKIVALDYAFPEGFPEVARDLIERLLVLDPAKRLPIEHIKNHRFFDGIRWGPGLWKQKAPRLKAYSPPAPEPIKLNGNASSLPPHMAALTGSRSGPSTAQPASNTAPRPSARVITELPPPSQLDIDWSPVLTRNNERILKLGNLMVTSTPAPHSPGAKSGEEAPKKFSRFFGGNTTKKRQRLVMVTSSARIVMAAAGGEEKKAKMEISLTGSGTTWKSYKDVKGLTAWCVDTREKHFTFEDPKATTSDPEGSKYSAQEWLDTVEQAKEFAISQQMVNSYSSDTFNELSSSLSSPASTLGGDAVDGVNVPTSRGHLRKDPGDSESIKGRKRFSRRHSKNGLAAVF